MRAPRAVGARTDGPAGVRRWDIRPLRLVAALGAVLLLPGCALLGMTLEFQAHKDSGVQQSRTALLIVTPEVEDADKALRDDIGRQAPGADAVLKRCAPAPLPGEAAAASATTPIVAALAEAGFNVWALAQQRRIEAIVQAARADYSVTQRLSHEQLQATRCLVITRYLEPRQGERAIGSVVVLSLKHSGDGSARAAWHAHFVMTPVYAWLANSAAVTRDDDPPKTSLSVAVSIKAVGMPAAAGGMPLLMPSGEGVTSIPRVAFGKGAAPRCVEGTLPCKTSDLVPYPTTRGELSLTLAVVETGVTGFDDKAALAELAALRAALGPAVRDAVKKTLD